MSLFSRLPALRALALPARPGLRFASGGGEGKFMSLEESKRRETILLCVLVPWFIYGTSKALLGRKKAKKV